MKQILLLFLCISTLNARDLTPNVLIALIDTTYRTQASYHNFIELNKAAGITIRFVHPSHNLEQDLCGCDGIFLALDNNFLNNLQSTYAQLVIEPIKTFLQKPQKLIGLLLPVQTKINASSIITCLQSFNISADDLQSDIDAFLSYQKKFKPLYTTQTDIASTKKLEHPIFKTMKSFQPKTFPSFLENNQPLALNVDLSSHYLFIAMLNQMTFADLEEYDTYNPIDPQKRRALFRLELDVLYSLSKKLYKQKEMRIPACSYNIIRHLVNKDRYKLNYTMYKKQKGLYQWTSNGIVCGWMSIDYDPQLMPTNLSYIAQTDFDMLWLELPIGIYKESDKFDQKISIFTKKLKQAFESHKRPLPKIFIDFDFGATLNWCLESDHPVDIYGTTYHEVPAPLDYKKFWKVCILETLKDVCCRWSTSIGNGIPIDGILFNFYFWNAKERLPFYNNLVDFSDSAWDGYKKHTDAPAISIPQERINYLIKQNKLSSYFITLEREAYELARLIQTDIRTILPCAMIGAYTKTPLDTWFYRGIMRGLGTQKNPLLWFTSNLNFYGHQQWINYNHINALHVTNVLLDHFNNPIDVRSINSLAHVHDGLWYSRVSRIGEKYEADKWWTPEATTMNPEKIIKLINKQARKH